MCSHLFVRVMSCAAVFCIRCNLIRVYLKDHVTVYERARTLRSENAMLVVQPKVPTKTYGERRFDKAASTLPMINIWSNKNVK
jgi:hypothetical protein